MPNNNIICLTDTEKNLLQNILIEHPNNTFFFKRAQLFLFLNDKYNYKEISKTLHLSASSIKRLKLTFLTEGLNSLFQIKKRGQKNHKLTPENESQLIELTKTKKPQLKKRWTIQSLTDTWNSNPSNQNKQISFYLVQKILKKYNINLGKGNISKRWLRWQPNH